MIVWVFRKTNWPSFALFLSHPKKVFFVLRIHWFRTKLSFLFSTCPNVVNFGAKEITQRQNRTLSHSLIRHPYPLDVRILCMFPSEFETLLVCGFAFIWKVFVLLDIPEESLFFGLPAHLLSVSVAGVCLLILCV